MAKLIDVPYQEIERILDKYSGNPVPEDDLKLLHDWSQMLMTNVAAIVEWGIRGDLFTDKQIKEIDEKVFSLRIRTTVSCYYLGFELWPKRTKDDVLISYLLAACSPMISYLSDIHVMLVLNRIMKRNKAISVAPKIGAMIGGSAKNSYDVGVNRYCKINNQKYDWQKEFARLFKPINATFENVMANMVSRKC